MKILVTGSSGFLGRSLVIKSLAHGHQITESRSLKSKNNTEKKFFINLDKNADWSDALFNVDLVIHLAARVHVMDENALNPLTEFRNINTEGTLTLAHQAASNGVKRFIFISSIKVNGEFSQDGKPFNEKSHYIPDDPYGLSKYEAEQGLFKIAEETGMEVVIIRPPLVYGPNVSANFASMMKWVYKGIPLPFGAVDNKRSLVALDNLVDFIIHCINHPKAANEIFLISDGEDVSTATLLKKVATAFGQKAWLLPIPVKWMEFVASLLGKRAVTDRLFTSLQLDSSKARDLLGWKPVITMDEQLKKTADAYIENEKML
ncbi:UNVERIFIED_CONTAM: hypothetical protein GTU68_010249 [Idotea baltica]|nr:hypothetical protein [Idotea baltica]